MKNILLTGATGVVGNNLLWTLLERLKNDVKIYLLIRADNEKHLNEKIINLNLSNEINEGKIIVIRGDISQENMGLEIRDLLLIRANVDIFIHAAANVKLNQPLSVARENALKGTRFAIQLAESCEKKCHFHYISTVGVNGMSNSVLLEDTTPENVQYHNTYEQAKAEAERYVIKKMKTDLYCTIYRPSMIVGNSKSGEYYAKQIFYYLCDFIINGSGGLFMPSLKTFKLDTIPIDYLSSFIVESICHSDNTVGKIYNICSGPIMSTQLDKLALLIQQCIQKKNSSSRKPIYLPLFLFRFYLKIIYVFSNKNIKNQLDSLQLLLLYLKNSPKFSNEQFLLASKQFDLSMKNPEEYLPIIIDYYIDSAASK